MRIIDHDCAYASPKSGAARHAADKIKRGHTQAFGSETSSITFRLCAPLPIAMQPISISRGQIGFGAVATSGGKCDQWQFLTRSLMAAAYHDPRFTFH